MLNLRTLLIYMLSEPGDPGRPSFVVVSISIAIAFATGLRVLSKRPRTRGILQLGCSVIVHIAAHNLVLVGLPMILQIRTPPPEVGRRRHLSLTATCQTANATPAAVASTQQVSSVRMTAVLQQ